MYCLVLFLISGLCGASRLQGWDYVNLHCRDNDNAPVDWWILYKPPSGNQPWEEGFNFSYISSDGEGKWTPSTALINGESMLKHTLAPMFRPTYQDHLAVATYAPKPRSNKGPGSTARGLMLADELSGLWISHTVPGLPDTTRERLHFPEDEIKNGHVIVCLSADYTILNNLAKRLREMDPFVTEVKIPDPIKHWLPDWMPMSVPLMPLPLHEKFHPKSLEYTTEDKKLRATVMVRRPGDKRCLYQIFAKTHEIILDVYNHHKRAHTICQKNYGVRKIDAISVNYPNHINDNVKHAIVHYVDNQTDRMEFAVSTAAPWQRKGGSLEPEYWVCIGSSADDVSGKGRVILCIEDYHVWRSFDILKIKEPEC